MLDSGGVRLLLVSASSSEEEVGHAGGAVGHGAAVPSGACGGAGRLEGHRGGSPPRGGSGSRPPRRAVPIAQKGYFASIASLGEGVHQRRTGTGSICWAVRGG